MMAAVRKDLRFLGLGSGMSRWVKAPPESAPCNRRAELILITGPAATSPAGHSVEKHAVHYGMMKYPQQLPTQIKGPEVAWKVESALAFLLQRRCVPHQSLDLRYW